MPQIISIIIQITEIVVRLLPIIIPVFIVCIGVLVWAGVDSIRNRRHRKLRKLR